ncbi:DUF4489 domain-containing protein [Vallitalea pronyensis]|uniref:DUF4489 domain-containing protein n=1 Tax=Vallitalea pronyensis TaxID=1348613 RepID=A0A8J8MLX9_9FIRM|nr:DUF4489 domain-containing protein [Vallitalea pronyensis]QUI23827.1 DUF4489 domain-containing protein [Vallitalea pronyensis]
MTGYIKNGSDCKNNDFKKKIADPKEIIFECGESIEAANFSTTSRVSQTFTLARVFVDSSCLCRPQVKIEFSTLVTFASRTNVDPVNLNMTFALKRQCDDGLEVTIREWEYTNSFDLENFTFTTRSVSEPFTISFCEPLQCPGCCKYSFVVTANPSTDFVNIMSASVNPNNDASMSAFAKGVCCD